MLQVDQLTVRYGKTAVLQDVSFSVEAGQWLMIVGPNGAGKSTIVKAVSQGVAYEGDIAIEGRDARRLKARELARSVGVLTQHHATGYAFTVTEVVRMGRYAYSGGLFGGQGAGEDGIVAAALEKTGLTALAHQTLPTLSGGERQRAFLAQVLAQDPRLLLLDEPTNLLDLVYQSQIFALIREWIQATGRAVVSVVHDLSLAKAYGTHALLLDRGRVVADGRAEEVLTEAHLDPVYHMDVAAWMRGLLTQWS